jgi:hypothetical protein
MEYNLMTYAGENTSSGIMVFVEDGTPDVVPMGNEGQVLSIDNGLLAFVDIVDIATSGHNLLSPTHLDTQPSNPIDGGFIYASGDLWRHLPIGQNGDVITTNASGFPEWRVNNLDIPNASGFNFLDGWHKFSIGPDTTSSTSYVPIDDMTVLPGSGTYAITFTSTISSTKGSSSLAIAIFIDEVIASGTERFTDFPSANNDTITATNGIVSTIGDESISIRWKRTGGPVSTVLGMDSRDMMGIRIRNQIDV